MWKAPPPAQEARPEFLDCRTVVSPGFPNLGSRQPSGESGLEVNRSVLWRRPSSLYLGHQAIDLSLSEI